MACHDTGGSTWSSSVPGQCPEGDFSSRLTEALAISILPARRSSSHRARHTSATYHRSIKAQQAYGLQPAIQPLYVNLSSKHSLRFRAVLMALATLLA